MQRLLTTTFVLTVSIASPLLAQQRLTPADYGRWESLGGASLSPDGRWLAYSVNRVDEENQLRIGGGPRDTTITVPFGSGPTFAGNSRWLAYSIGVSPKERERLTAAKEPVRNDVGIVDLRTAASIVIDDIGSFRFSGDGRHLAMRGYPAEGKRMASLIVRDLERGSQITFGNVVDYAWSQPGALLAMTLETESGTGNAVQVYDAASGALRVLDGADARYRELTWREDADDLLVLRTRTDSAFSDTSHVVLAWRGVASASPVQHTLAAGAPGLPAALRVSETRTPEWSEDGRVVFIGLRPREAKPARNPTAADSTATNGGPPDSTRANGEEKKSDVQVWHARDVRIIPMQKAQEQRDLDRTLLAAWHMDDNRVVQLGTDLLESVTILDDGRHVIETDRKPYAFGVMFGRASQDVYAIDIDTGERRKLLEDVQHFEGPSATGRLLTWFDGEDWWSVDVATGARTNLTANVEADFVNRDHDYPVEIMPPEGAAGWTEEDGALLVYDAFDVWSLAPDGSGGQRLTNGASEQLVHRYVNVYGSDDGIDLSKPLYLSINGRRTKQSGYARMRADRAPEPLILEDARVARLVRADSADTFAFTRERFDDSPDWFLGGAELRAARQVTTTNVFEKDYAWGHSELVDFTSASGKDLQAVLLYPAGYDASRKYPMIVYTYELLSQNVHNYVVPTERSYYNFNVWTANDYFVLMPDIVYRGGDPGISALEAVEPAVKSIVDRGLVDPARVGLIGHSWGGYQAAYLPTRTNIFAASVAGAPITNFLSFAGAIHWTPGNPEFDHWETGQARMGVPPWEDMEAYLRNSPIHEVDQLETPMLMVFGDADGVVDWQQGVEFYNFARRAGKDDFVMLVYPGEDHGLRKKENQIDYHRRILQWFGHWLKGEEAPEWMTEGVTWLERKKALEGG